MWSVVEFVVDKCFGGRFAHCMKLMRWPSGSVTEKLEYPTPITSQCCCVVNLEVTWIFWTLRYFRSELRSSVSKTISASKFEGAGEGAPNSATTCCRSMEKVLGDFSWVPRIWE